MESRSSCFSSCPAMCINTLVWRGRGRNNPHGVHEAPLVLFTQAAAGHLRCGREQSPELPVRHAGMRQQRHLLRSMETDERAGRPAAIEEPLAAVDRRNTRSTKFSRTSDPRAGPRPRRAGWESASAVRPRRYLVRSAAASRFDRTPSHAPCRNWASPSSARTRTDVPTPIDSSRRRDHAVIDAV